VREGEGCSQFRVSGVQGKWCFRVSGVIRMRVVSVTMHMPAYANRYSYMLPPLPFLAAFLFVLSILVSSSLACCSGLQRRKFGDRFGRWFG
jgi:hypothetical protein